MHRHIKKGRCQGHPTLRSQQQGYDVDLVGKGEFQMSKDEGKVESLHQRFSQLQSGEVVDGGFAWVVGVTIASAWAPLGLPVFSQNALSNSCSIVAMLNVPSPSAVGEGDSTSPVARLWMTIGGIEGRDPPSSSVSSSSSSDQSDQCRDGTIVLVPDSVELPG